MPKLAMEIIISMRKVMEFPVHETWNFHEMWHFQSMKHGISIKLHFQEIGFTCMRNLIVYKGCIYVSVKFV